MSVITPAPQPKSDIFREVEQLQNSFKNNESKVLVDNNKIYKKLKEKKKKIKQKDCQILADFFILEFCQ